MNDGMKKGVDEVRLTVEEQETVVNFMRDNDKAVVYTSDTTMITKLDKLIAGETTEWRLEDVHRLKMEK